MSDYIKKSKQYKGFHYSVLSSVELDYLHKKTLEMLRIIVELFNKHDIRYMICGGTLLGAMTTGDFIPWDDDVDLCVLEDDYDRMMECLYINCPEWMIVQSKDTEPSYYHGWVKVRDRYSKIYPDEKKYSNNGVWVDIYKLAKVKCKEMPLNNVIEHIDYLERRYSVGCITRQDLYKRVIFNRLISKYLTTKLEATLSKDESTAYVILSASKVRVEEDWIFPLRDYTFEGLLVKSFNKSEEYLKQHYGHQYMIVPKYEDRRVGINKIEIFS